ncbi:MAG: matrixin [Parcubacteria group bacterium]|nr:matrixin [Parcubacteria group bacterium]
MKLEKFKPVTQYLLPVAILGAVAYTGIHYNLFPSLAYFNKPCDKPVVYSIGAYDERFGISQTEYESALKEAADLWNTAAGKTVVTYAATGTVPVNLIYGEHQQAVELGKAISTEQSAYDAKKAEVESLRKEYSALKTQYEAAAAKFDADNKAYEKEVEYWNKQGGAPPGKYEELAQQRSRLETRQNQLNRQVAQVNSMANRLNVIVDELNNLAQRTNSKVSVYNKAVGDDFDQGNYVSDAEGERINIYEFSTRTELKRVLAHEFGHALGLDHVENPDSIMYSYDLGNEFKLTTEDIAALREVCAIE